MAPREPRVEGEGTQLGLGLWGEARKGEERDWGRGKQWRVIEVVRETGREIKGPERPETDRQEETETRETKRDREEDIERDRDIEVHTHRQGQRERKRLKETEKDTQRERDRDRYIGEGDRDRAQTTLRGRQGGWRESEPE